MSIQLDFWNEKSEVDILEDRVKKMEVSLDKQRKKLFANNGDLSKKYIDIHNRLEILERNICKGKYG